MNGSQAARPIWAKWRLHDDGRVHVVATYGEEAGFVQREIHFESIAQAAEALGPSFEDVVMRAHAAGSTAGRWRP